MGDRTRAALSVLRQDRARALDLHVYTLALACVGAGMGIGVTPIASAVLACSAVLVMSLALLRAPAAATEAVMGEATLMFGAFVVAIVTSAGVYLYAPDFPAASAPVPPTVVAPIAACTAPASTPGAAELGRWLIATSSGFGAFGVYAGLLHPVVRRPTYDEFSTGWVGLCTVGSGGTGVLALLTGDTLAHAAEVVVARAFFGLLLAGAAALGAVALGILGGRSLRAAGTRLTRVVPRRTSPDAVA